MTGREYASSRWELLIDGKRGRDEGLRGGGCLYRPLISKGAHGGHFSTHSLGRLDGRRWEHAIDSVLAVLFGPFRDLVERLMHPSALVQGRVAIGKCASSRVARQALAFGLLCKVLLRDLLVVLVDNIFGDSFHAKNLNLEALAAGNGILDVSEVLLVDLVHVHRETCVCKHARGARGGASADLQLC